MENEMRYAVLIDADNVAAKYTKNILDELSQFVEKTGQISRFFVHLFQIWRFLCIFT